MNTPKLEKQRILNKLKQLEIGSEEYNRALTQYMAFEKQTTALNVEMLGLAVNFASLVTVLNYEKLGVLTSKAVMYLRKR